MPFPRGSVPLHKMRNTFPPFLASNKEWFFGGFSYVAWYIKFSLSIA